MMKTPAQLQEAGIKRLSIVSQSHIVALLNLKWQHNLRGAALDLLRQDRDIQFVGAIDTSSSMYMYENNYRRLFLTELAAIQNPMTVLEYGYRVAVHREVDPTIVRLNDEMGSGDNGLTEVLTFGNTSHVLIMFTDETGYERASMLPIDQPIIWVVIQQDGTSVSIHTDAPTNFVVLED